MINRTIFPKYWKHFAASFKHKFLSFRVQCCTVENHGLVRINSNEIRGEITIYCYLAELIQLLPGIF